MGDDVFGEDGVAVGNPHLRRVGTFSDAEDGPEMAQNPRGIWIPLNDDIRSFRMRVEQPGVFTVEHLGDDLGWGIEWVQDE